MLTLWGHWFIALEKCLGESNISALFVGIRSLIFKMFFWLFVSSNASDGSLTSTIAVEISAKRSQKPAKA